jgi:hypothetical protein
VANPLQIKPQLTFWPKPDWNQRLLRYDTLKLAYLTDKRAQPGRDTHIDPELAKCLSHLAPVVRPARCAPSDAWLNTVLFVCERCAVDLCKERHTSGSEHTCELA